MHMVRPLEAAVVFAVILGLGACAGQREARPPSSEPATGNPDLEARAESPKAVDAPSQDEPKGKAKDKPDDHAGEGPDGNSAGESVTPESTKPAVEPATQGPGLKEVCEKLTRRAKQKCSPQVAEMYESSCGHYLKAKGDCEEQQRLLLECQLKASDARLCAHEADHNCAEANRELKTCQRGAAPSSQLEPEDDRTLPADWAQIEDKVLGFTVAMPPGAALDPASKRRTWTAESGGITYHVAQLEAPSGKLDNQAYVKTLVTYVSGRCQRGMKLRGDLEVKGTTVVQYQTACPDKTEWRGMLHFWNGKAVSTAYHAPIGVRGVEEPFFYSFVIAGQQR